MCIRDSWKTVDLAEGTAGYYMSVTTAGLEQSHAEITDVGLAGSWFYGDLVHADQGQIDLGKSFGIEHRFAAAAVRAAQLAILTRELLTFVHVLVEEGVIEVSQAALKDLEVKVEPKDLELASLVTAPTGTPMPGPAGTPIGEEWQSAFPEGDEDGMWSMTIPWGEPD